MTNEKTKNLVERTKVFAHNGVKLAIDLPNTYLGNHIKGQLIRCVTSVASNYRAVCIAQSKAAFVSKLSIVIEETDESSFWLEFILEEKMMDNYKAESLLSEAKELMSIFVASRKTARKI